MRTVDLQACREELDQIDRQIVELFERRMAVCGDVASYKIETGKAVYDGVRERQKLEAVEAMAHGNFNQTAVRELYSQMMTISRRYQYRLLAEHGTVPDLGFTRVDRLPADHLRVVYQGVEGAYSHRAALQFFGQEEELYHVVHFEDAMKEVIEGRADYAVLPIENSSAGAVIDNYDLLIQYPNYIVAEVFVGIDHALLGLPGAKLSDVRTVFSHPQALMQCSSFLNQERNWKQVSLENTAVSARKVLEDRDVSQAAVASEIAGKIYGLSVLKPSIQNSRNNTTRFIVLSRTPMYRKDAKKVTITFELAHKSGTLYNILGHFIFNGVNMRMIESRPIPERTWEYRFFIDIEGNLDDPGIVNALQSIRAESQNMRIIGNY